jgi:ABC-type polysaccharide/polyol phosphate export permease
MFSDKLLNKRRFTMQVVSLIWGILALVGMLVGFIPFLGMLNWLNIPFAGIGLLISIIVFVSTAEGKNKSGSITGIICCSIAVLFGMIRLFMGGGII